LRRSTTGKAARGRSDWFRSWSGLVIWLYGNWKTKRTFRLRPRHR